MEIPGSGIINRYIACQGTILVDNFGVFSIFALLTMKKTTLLLNFRSIIKHCSRFLANGVGGTNNISSNVNNCY